MSDGVRSEVFSRINDALAGFNVRVQNISIDLNDSITTDEDAVAFRALITDYSTRLSAQSDSVMTQADSLVESHAFDRPLLRPTGERKGFSDVKLGEPSSFSYEFKNVGRKPWSGWMVIEARDQYKKSVIVDYAAPSIPIVAPGESVWLTRDITIPKVVMVNGNPHTWGKTTIHTSIYTRSI